MAINLTRRKFLQAATCAAAAIPFARMAKAEDIFVRKPYVAPGSFAGTKSVTGGICGMCFWRCQLVGKVRDGKLIKLEGNPKSIDNGKSICARGNAGIKLLYDPDRLKYPMKNIGKRGAPVWKRISWEAALDECASRMNAIIDEYDESALAIFPHGSSAKYPMEFFEYVVGTPNNSEASFFQCRGARDMAYLNTIGAPADEDVDMPNAKAIFMLGTHLGENVHVSHLKKYLKGLENGAKLIVVDPRFSSSAAKADIWVQIKPGTDTAFLVAIMNYLVKEEKYDEDYVDFYGYGFEEFVEGISHATLDWAAKICDVPAKQIKQVADLLAENAPNVSIHPGRHTSWSGNDFQRERGLACLTALLGTIGVKGGFVKPINPKVGRCGWPRLVNPHEDSLHYLAHKYPYSPPGTPTDLIRETALSGDPYPIKGMIVWGQNPMQTIPDQQLTIKMIEKMDFVMVCDVMPTDITMYADILLPETCYLERYDYVKKGTQWDYSQPHQQYISARVPLVSPTAADHERKDSVWITNELAKRMDYEEEIPVKTSKEMVENILAGAGLSLKQLEQEDGIHIQPGQDPYDVQYDVSFYNSSVAEAGFPGAPTYLPCPQPPKGHARLIYGRVPVHSFNRTQNNAWLYNEIPRNPVWINDEVATTMGLKDGDEISLVNEVGIESASSSILKTTPGIRKDVIYTSHGYGSRNPQLSIGVNAGIDDNALISARTIDPETGTHGMRNSFVRIIKQGKILDIPA